VGAMLRRAFDKSVWTWPPVGAADAGPMEIQLWGRVRLRRAEAVLPGTLHDTVRSEMGYGGKMSERRSLKKLQEGIRLGTRQKGTARAEGYGVFELERMVSCDRADPRWRTKLDFGSG
jgi:hypothetical protein